MFQDKVEHKVGEMQFTEVE